MLLTIVIGLRNQVGGDWWNYLTLFAGMKHGSLLHAVNSTEPSYAFLNWVAGRAGWGIWFPNLACAAIFSWGLVALARQQPNPWLAIASATYLIVLVGMGYTRQSAALGFVMLALAQYTTGNSIRMAIYLGAAVTFHNSAIIMAPILALAVARRGIPLLIVLGVLVGLLLYEFSGHLLDVVNTYRQELFSATGALPRLLMNLIAAFIFFAIPRRLASDASERRLWTIVSVATLFSVLLLFVFSSSLVVDRVGLYLAPLQIVVLSRLPTALPGRGPNMLVLLSVLTYSLIILVGWLSLGTWGHAWLPYRNYLWETTTSRTPPHWFRYGR